MYPGSLKESKNVIPLDEKKIKSRGCQGKLKREKHVTIIFNQKILMFYRLVND